jgi:hypothetical protein
MAETFPRPLTHRERELLMWVLPEDRSGYATMRASIESMLVVGAGRRGEGNYILGPAGHIPDNESPLPSVVAIGSIETDTGGIPVTVREEERGQIEFEIGSLPSSLELRRWTLSTWTPGDACPQCGNPARNVAMSTESGRRVTLALCAKDRRLWVHEERSGMCRPVPVTLYYSELMRRMGVRDPKMALRSQRLFERLSEFEDEVLTAAFVAYNRIRAKVQADDPLRLPQPRRSFLRRLFTFSRT